MKISKANLALLLLCVGGAGCAADNPPADEEPVEVAEQALTSGECRTPRPKDRGCKITCKPCSYAVCEDGKWVWERVDWGEECNGGGGFAGGGQCCQVPFGSWCPAECQCCTN